MFVFTTTFFFRQKQELQTHRSSAGQGVSGRGQCQRSRAMPEADLDLTGRPIRVHILQQR